MSIHSDDCLSLNSYLKNHTRRSELPDIEENIPAVVNILCKVLKLLYMGFQDESRGALVSQAQIHKEI